MVIQVAFEAYACTNFSINNFKLILLFNNSGAAK